MAALPSPLQHRPCSTKVTNSEQIKSPLAIILQFMARRALADRGSGNNEGNTRMTSTRFRA
jgi:hypothetical protein